MGWGVNAKARTAKDQLGNSCGTSVAAPKTRKIIDSGSILRSAYGPCKSIPQSSSQTLDLAVEKSPGNGLPAGSCGLEQRSTGIS